MSKLKRQLPPLGTLVAFEAAARLESFSRAAEEINVTQAAVSRQIHLLETSLRCRLFTRQHRSVKLTPEGRDYLHVVVRSLSHLANATQEQRLASADRSLTIGCDETVALMWLMPRLTEFRSRARDVAIRVVVNNDESVCLASDITIAILHGDGRWSERESRMIIEDIVVPVCSPSYLESRPRIERPEDLVEEDLLDLEDNHWHWINWRIWLTDHGVNLPSSQRRLTFTSYPAILEAARLGNGIALGWKQLLVEDFERGSLVRVGDWQVQTGLGYYLAWTSRRQLTRLEAEFCVWAAVATTS
ncbi:MAG: LysR family transcriptional regulator [Rhizobiales bacterium]|nr:LysR family transcriptional regulator [Hyphomicrobiales bacterium]